MTVTRRDSHVESQRKKVTDGWCLATPAYSSASHRPFDPLQLSRCNLLSCFLVPVQTVLYALGPYMQSEHKPSFLPYLCQRFQVLIWSCLDSDLTKSAVFYAERFFAMDHNNHDARHLYATALLREGQTYSAMCLVNIPRDGQCGGCLEIKAKCCTILGRHRQAREALEETLREPNYTPFGQS